MAQPSTNMNTHQTEYQHIVNGYEVHTTNSTNSTPVRRHTFSPSISNFIDNYVPSDIYHFKNIHGSYYVYIGISVLTYYCSRELKIGRTLDLYTTIRCFRTCTQKCEMVFYRDCKTYFDSVVVKRNVIEKLKSYRAPFSHNRIVVPTSKNMKDFIDVINQCANDVLKENGNGVTVFNPI